MSNIRHTAFELSTSSILLDATYSLERASGQELGIGVFEGDVPEHPRSGPERGR